MNHRSWIDRSALHVLAAAEIAEIAEEVTEPSRRDEVVPLSGASGAGGAWRCLGVPRWLGVGGFQLGVGGSPNNSWMVYVMENP